MRYYIGDYGSSRGLRGMMYSVLCLPSRRFEETYHCVKFLRFSLQNSKQVQDDRPIVHGGLLVVQPSSTSCRGLNYKWRPIMASCQTTRKTPSGSLKQCSSTLVRCTKCGKSGCTNKDCPNYMGSTSLTICSYCRGKLERIKQHKHVQHQVAPPDLALHYEAIGAIRWLRKLHKAVQGFPKKFFSLAL